MNEYLEKMLIDELKKDVDRRYGDWFEKQKASGAEVQKNVYFTPEKNGKHTGEARFYIGSKAFSALYEYIQGAGPNPSHWYMVRDWRD